MHPIALTRVALENAYTVRCDFETAKPLRRFFAQNYFFATFNRKIDTVPTSILIIPFLANVAPIVWATDSTLTAPVVDKEFLESLPQLRQSFQNMYPRNQFRGSIKAERVEKNKNDATSSFALLFSGGVDSLTSFIQTKSNSPCLVTVWGADISLEHEDAWNLVRSNLECFAQAHSLENLFIKSNLRTFIHEFALNAEFGNSIADWWGSVQHGMGLLGLCAPLGYSLGIKTLLIPSSYTEDFNHPWGSHPSIDNLVRWTGTEVIHHGYDYTRQQKLHVIADYIKSEDPDLQIRACFSSTTGTNCCKCEKCSRTITGLLLEGVDPARHGFSYDEETFANIQRQLTQGAWNIGEGGVFFWQDIQRKIPLVKVNAYQTYFDWLAQQDFEVLKESAAQNRFRKLRKVASHLPAPAYTLLKRVKSVLVNQ